MKKSDFPVKLYNMLTYKHELSIKKEHTFNTSIKCFNGLKTSDEGQGGEHCETTNT